MEPIPRRLLCACYRPNGCMSKVMGAGRIRTMATKKSIPKAKPPKSKPIPKSPNPKPMEYKPSIRKPISQTSAKPPVLPKNVLRYRTQPIIFGGLTLFAMTAYMTYAYIEFTRPNIKGPASASPSSQEDVSSQYDHIAKSFDDDVNAMETTMRIKSLRKKIASEAQGDVLEVSIGTGRNLEFYDWNFKGHHGVGKIDARGDMKRGKIRSFTAIDKSGEMLQIAHEKFSKMFPGILGVRWIIADASEEGKIPGPPRNANERSGNLESKYDTVVQTMGLCSVSDPVGLLRNLGEVVKEEEGRILLLEHGRGRWDWLNGYLDKTAEDHAKQFGCWWNRDMRAIVEESGLEVVKIETPKWWHGGTTWWIELKKPKGDTGTELVKKSPTKVMEAECNECKKDDTPKKVEQEKPESPPKKKGWW